MTTQIEQRKYCIYYYFFDYGCWNNSIPKLKYGVYRYVEF